MNNETENYYDLSDDELLAMDLKIVAEDSEETTNVQDEQVDESFEQDEPEPEQEENQEDTQDDDESEVNTDADEIDETDNQTESENQEENIIDENEDVLDDTKFRELLTKPFKANGREIQLTDPKDMIALMQKGANYSKKMEQLKPNLNLIKTLEKHGLTDTEKLGYLLDLYNKKPEAIAKLVKDADIDLYSFDAESADNYSPNRLEVEEVNPVQEVINELTESNPDFNAVLAGIVTTWDKESQSILSERPELLRILNEQVQSGMYDRVMGIVERERMLGRMKDKSYLESYSIIESQLLSQESKEFTGTRPTPKQENNNTKKMKASAGKAKANEPKETFNPLAISDEELMNMTFT